MRHERVSLILITTDIDHNKYILRQWDEKAHQYQIIGGRQEDNESPLETSIREMKEELPELNLEYGTNFQLMQLLQKPAIVTGVSPTYDIDTHYTFHLFNAILHMDRLSLNSRNKWSKINDLLTCSLDRKEDVSFYNLIFRSIPGGTDALPISIESNRIESIQLL